MSTSLRVSKHFVHDVSLSTHVTDVFVKCGEVSMNEALSLVQPDNLELQPSAAKHHKNGIKIYLILIAQK